MGAVIWFTDGRKAGAAIVDDTGRVIWTEALPPGTSPQKVELIAVIQALERAKGKKITIYTDSRYAFGTVHIYGPIYKEWQFLTGEGKEIRNLPDIRRLLAAVHLPQAVSIVHVPGHQKGEDARARGNCAANAAAREVADGYCQAHMLAVGLPPPGMGTLPPSPIYSPSDLSWMEDNTYRPAGKDGWYQDQDDNLLLPADLGRHFCTHLHQTTHLGEEKDFDASTSSTAAVSPTKENHTGHSLHLQGLSDDETGKRTAHGCKIPGGKAGTALGDRFYRGKARQVWLSLPVSFG